MLNNLLVIYGAPNPCGDRLCECLVITMKENHYRYWFSKERIANSDEFFFKRPITKPDHFSLVIPHHLLKPWIVKELDKKLIVICDFFSMLKAFQYAEG